MAQPPTIYKPGRLNSVWNYLGSSLKSFANALSPYISGGGGSTPSGPNRSVQYNDNGSLGGDADLKYEVGPSVVTGLTYVSSISLPGPLSANIVTNNVWTQQGYTFVLSIKRDYSNPPFENYITVYDSTGTQVGGTYLIDPDLPASSPGQFAYESYQLYGDGTYLYVSVSAESMDVTGGIAVYQYNVGTNTFSFIDFNNQYHPNTYSIMWGDGTYIYSATTITDGLNNGAITAYKVQGGSLNVIGRYAGPDLLYYYSSVFCQNGLIYVGTYDWDATGDSVVQAYTFNGTTFTKVHQITISITFDLSGLTGDGTYLYVGDYGSSYFPGSVSGIIAFAYDSVTGFTEITGIATPETNSVSQLYYYDNNIWPVTFGNFTGDPTSDPYYSYQFDGITFTSNIVVPRTTSSYQVSSISIDANNYYITWSSYNDDISELYVYSKDFLPPTKKLTLNGDLEVTGNVTTGVKKYVALLMQTFGNAPVATVLENTFSSVPVWTRTGDGDYECLCPEFVQDKTVCQITLGANGNYNLPYFGPDISIGNEKCRLTTVNPITNVPEDWSNDPNNDTTVEIRVYP